MQRTFSSVHHEHVPGKGDASIALDDLGVRSFRQDGFAVLPEAFVADELAAETDHVFPDAFGTTPTGGLVLRQTVAKLVKQAARTAGITAQLATQTGRRSVITTLYVDGDEALEDIAQFVGHAKTSTTAGYVTRLGRRPKTVADRAAALLDGRKVAARKRDS